MGLAHVRDVTVDPRILLHAILVQVHPANPARVTPFRSAAPSPWPVGSRWTIEKVMALPRGNGSLATVGVYDDDLVVVFDTRPDGRRNSVVRIAHIKL